MAKEEFTDEEINMKFKEEFIDDNEDEFNYDEYEEYMLNKGDKKWNQHTDVWYVMKHLWMKMKVIYI